MNLGSATASASSLQFGTLEDRPLCVSDVQPSHLTQGRRSEQVGPACLGARPTQAVRGGTGDSLTANGSPVGEPAVAAESQALGPGCQGWNPSSTLC